MKTDYLIPEEDEKDNWEQQAQEEAHQHFVSVEFSHMLVEDGVACTLGKLSKEAQREIRAMITLHGNNLL